MLGCPLLCMSVQCQSRSCSTDHDGWQPLSAREGKVKLHRLQQPGAVACPRAMHNCTVDCSNCQPAATTVALQGSAAPEAFLPKLLSPLLRRPATRGPPKPKQHAYCYRHAYATLVVGDGSERHKFIQTHHANMGCMLSSSQARSRPKPSQPPANWPALGCANRHTSGVGEQPPGRDPACPSCLAASHQPGQRAPNTCGTPTSGAVPNSVGRVCSIYSFAMSVEYVLHQGNRQPTL